MIRWEDLQTCFFDFHHPQLPPERGTWQAAAFPPLFGQSPSSLATTPIMCSPPNNLLLSPRKRDKERETILKQTALSEVADCEVANWSVRVYPWLGFRCSLCGVVQSSKLRDQSLWFRADMFYLLWSKNAINHTLLPRYHSGSKLVIESLVLFFNPTPKSDYFPCLILRETCFKIKPISSSELRRDAVAGLYIASESFKPDLLKRQ